MKTLMHRHGKLGYVLLVAVVLASAATGILPAIPAAAHYATVSGSVSCTQDYQQQVTWTVSNSEGASHPMDITSINRSVSGIGVGTTVGTSVSGTETIAGGTSGTITLTVGAHWAFDGYTTTGSGSVKLLGSKCTPPPPTATFTPSGPTATPSATDTPKPPTVTFTPTNTHQPPTSTFTPTYTSSPTNQPTDTFTYTPVNTSTFTPTKTPVVPTSTFTSTATFTSTWTNTPTNTPVVPTSTFTSTATFTSTWTDTPTRTFTSSPTDTATNTPTNTATDTPTNTSTDTLPAPSATFTPTFTSTPQLSEPVSVYCFSLTNNTFDVTITNNGAAGYVGYSVDGGATINSAFLAFGASELVTVPAGTTSLTLYAKLNAGDAWTGPVGSISLDRTNVCEKDPIHIAFFCTGNGSTPDGWSVTNENTFDVEITWQASSGSPASSGSISIPAGQTYTFSTASITGNMQVFINGQLMAQSSAGDCSKPPSTTSLTLSAFCAANPVAYNGWWVTNHGSSDASFTWKIQGTTVTGSGSVPANATIYFLTAVQSVADVLQLSYNGSVQATVPALTTCLKTPPILIPVTGADSNPLRHSWPFILGSALFALAGIGLVIDSLRRRKLNR